MLLNSDYLMYAKLRFLQFQRQIRSPLPGRKEQREWGWPSSEKGQKFAPADLLGGRGWGDSFRPARLVEPARLPP